MQQILKEKTVLNDKLIVEEGEILFNKEEKYSRMRVNHEDAATVLILNTDTNKVVLTKQFRYAITSKTKEHIIEIVAGKVGKKEKPIQTVGREAEEEIGYKIKPDRIKFLLSCFSTPGYSSERFFVYYATVTNADKASEGKGVKSEHEHIKIIEMDLIDFTTLIRNGEIKDAKTYIAGLYLVLQLISSRIH